jgi:putative ABC transport system permease protein
VASSLVGGLLLLLLIVFVVTLILAVRHRLAFRIALRNVRRGRARTALLIAGLLVGTTIVSGSLVVGATVQTLSYHYVYLGAGYVDEAISAESASGGAAYFPYPVYDQVVNLTGGYSKIAGITPEIVDAASVYDRTTGIPETNLNLIGVNANQSAALGSFVADNGTPLAGPLPGHVLLDDQAASALNATAGDAVLVYGITAVPLVVQAVVQENIRGAFITAGLTPGNVFVTLSTAQAIENQTGRINYLAVVNTGSQTSGAAASSEVSAYLNTTLAPVLSTYHLSVKTPLQNSLNAETTASQGIESLFLVLGLFSIVAGAMLIIGIFVMLAEERKGEMGMLRAIGMRSRELVYSYFFEGVVYSAGSALAGTVAGVGVGYVLIYLVGFLLQSEGIPQSAIVASFTVTGQDLVAAYVVGFLLTLVTVIVAARRASRLNIVRAIRDIPEPRPPVRTYTFLAYLGVVAVLLGALLFATTARGTGDLSYPILGGAIAILGIGLIAARFVKNRYAFTGAGLALLVWTGYEPLHVALFGSSHSSTLFNLFVIGILLVTGALLLILFNADLLARGLRRLLGPRARSSPVVRIGLDYPTRQPGRTAIGLTIFALVVFTMIATAAAGSTVEGSLNDTIGAESGGYTYFAYSVTPLPNLWTAIESNHTLAPLFVNAAPLVTGAIRVAVPGSSGKPFPDQIYAPPANATGPGSFLATNQFPFESTLPGKTAAATWQELATNRSAAVVDGSYAELASAFSTGSSGHPELTVGTTIQLTNPGGGHATNVTVIGILTQEVVTGVWVNPTTAASMGYLNQTAYFLTAAPGVSTTYAAQQALKAFFPSGIVLFDIEGLLASSISTTEGFIGILEVFVGLGLGVGIAAMGIFALRAVSERRREIGMLRATGFTQGMVLRSLVLEYSFVTLLGIAVGVTLGLLVIYNLSIGPTAATNGVQVFVAPWATIVEVAAIAYLLVLVAIAGPSLRAARLPPAEAVRTSE